MKYLSTIVLVFVMLALPLANTVALADAVAAEPAYSGYPTFSIVSVVKDTSVTIKTYNLPANDNFKARMCKMGTKAVNGTNVGSFDSGSGGVKTFTFNIPAGLQGLKKIAIRFDAQLVRDITPITGFITPQQAMEAVHRVVVTPATLHSKSQPWYAMIR